MTLESASAGFGNNYAPLEAINISPTIAILLAESYTGQAASGFRRALAWLIADQLARLYFTCIAPCRHGYARCHRACWLSHWCSKARSLYQKIINASWLAKSAPYSERMTLI